MKKICLKSYVIPILVTLICSTIYLHNTKNEIIYETKKIIKTANVLKTIEEENKNNTLIKENKFNDIKDLLYSENDNLKSYFADEKIDEITDIYSIIKKDCKSNFDAKINELLNLKYPKFIVEAINNSSTKNYEIKDNEMIIYYTDLNINLEEKLFLTVNVNESKD